ncbi:hypothetical protein CDL12_08943 [Handroanthus impetiginosus]|uniref:Gibberellin regulated protein n=1 Tax=Handroanthus impetiginosus TaxID=429701 RepID=A0A2G9HLH4_9LAMI|nr:hypothetical protein CDL12_08943 [Handroanthus impetiginosus]
MKLLFSILLLAFLLFSSCFLRDAAADAAALAPGATGSCSDLCNTRCGKAGIAKRCFNYCSICCSKCNCVPSGTYGNKAECPCYRDMLNPRGKPKCP